MNKVDSRLIKPNRMSDDEIRSILLGIGIQALRKQAGYIAPVNPEIEPVTYGDSPMAGIHTYSQNMRYGQIYDMVITADKRVWLRGMIKERFSTARDLKRMYMKFLLLYPRKEQSSV